MNDPVVYKILTAEQWAALDAGVFTGAPIDLADGFVHLSTAGQLAETLDLHFAGRTDLVIAAIDVTGCGAAMRWEPSRRGTLFPHLHAPLTRDAVIGWCRLERSPGGAVRLPARSR